MKKADQAGRAGPAVERRGASPARPQANAVRLDGYESSIAYLDEQIGRLFDELRSRGLLENTLVIVTSDHGEHFQERGFSGHGMSVYRREIHVPLLIFPPRSIAGPADRPRTGEPARPARHGRRPPRPGLVLTVPGPIARPLLPPRDGFGIARRPGALRSRPPFPRHA